ncbi:gamma-tubulin complex component protein [Thamnocephalis sphaerospora]|uniref:Spindle pole body component n=1 Tax=Thamnocephalis sphaerospora TaxID=78915 RepID=A0A4V1IW70_9FUNG|nr:gamma-tubulin complex component protein [Thamnocephalis sphaerospora]|eukprot:RKP06529.1 gamma-tubulin complex component protein [Thamnocephalis sphaerospora]
MLHELLLALSGHPGDVFVLTEQSFVVASDLAFLSEQERTALNRLGQLGWAYRECARFAFEQRRCNGALPVDAQGLRRPHGVYVDAFCASLDRLLDDYRARLARLEAGLIADLAGDPAYGRDGENSGRQERTNKQVHSAASGDIGGSVRTLTDVLSVLVDYETIFPTLLSLLDEMRQQPAAWHGVLLAERLRVHYQQTGAPLLRGVFRDLTTACLQVMWRQATSWLVYGLLQDEHGEFFVRKRPVIRNTRTSSTDGGDAYSDPGDDSAARAREPVWRRQHETVVAAVPSWIDQHTAEDLLFIGQAVLAVQERGHEIPAAWTDIRLRELHQLMQSVHARIGGRLETGGDAFARMTRAARRDLSDWLWRTAVQQHQAADQLRSFRNYFLLGRGDFFDALLDGVERHRSGSATVPTRSNSDAAQPAAAVGIGAAGTAAAGGGAPGIRDRELRALWSRAAANTSAEDDPCFARFRLERAPDLADAEVFGAPARLHYQLEWPFDLMVAPAELARYDAVFLCLLAVRSAQRRLQRTNWRVRSRGHHRNKQTEAFQRRLWHLRNAMQCFVDQVWAHMQMDVIEVHFQRLCAHLQDAAAPRSFLAADDQFGVDADVATVPGKHHDIVDNGVSQISAGPMPTAPRKPRQEHDFTDLQLAHAHFLDAICKGCLISTPAVFTAIRTAVRCCAQLAGSIERAQEIDAMTTVLSIASLGCLEKEFLKNAAFVFRTLSSVSLMPGSGANGKQVTAGTSDGNAPPAGLGARNVSLEADVRRHLDQLLLRLDYNQWYSSQTIAPQSEISGE